MLGASLLQNARFEVVSNNTAAGTGDVTSDEVDMASDNGYDSVLFLVKLGTVTATGVASVHAEQDTVTGMAGAANLEGTSIALAASAGSDTIIALDVRKPEERFVRIIVGRATANVEVDSILAIQYNPRTTPVTQGADVSGSEVHDMPIEGTP